MRFLSQLLESLRQSLSGFGRGFLGFLTMLFYKPPSQDDLDREEAREHRRQAMQDAKEAREERLAKKSGYQPELGASVRAAARAIIRGDMPEMTTLGVSTWLYSMKVPQLSHIARLSDADMKALMTGSDIGDLKGFRVGEWTGKALVDRVMAQTPSPEWTAHLAREQKRAKQARMSSKGPSLPFQSSPVEIGLPIPGR